MAPNYYHNHAATKSYPFMSCIIRVDTRSNWQRTVRKVLDKCNGVANFRMDDNGVVEISGTVDPSVLLKMLEKAGRSAELSWFQFGDCSSNLFMQNSNPGPGGGSYYARDGRHLHVGNTPRPNLPHSQQVPVPVQNVGYYDHYYSYANDQGYNNYRGYSYPQLGDGYGYGYDYESGYSHATENQIHNPSALPYRTRRDEDIGCCRVM